MADFKGPSQTNFYQAGRQTLIQIGTSGWTYKHWKGTFYPEGLPQRKWLEFYAARFSTVEINASFYHIPKASTAQGWAERTPPDFRFAVKVSRLITHVRKLTNCEETVDWFFRELWPMNKKVQAYLLQLPPSFCPSEERLESFLQLLPKENRYVFEFRNKEAYSGKIPDLLERQGIGFCIHDLPGRESPILVTSPMVYLRFHGFQGLYSGSYPEEILAEWAERLIKWKEEDREVLVYFNNDIGGHAVKNALTLRRLIAGAI